MELGHGHPSIVADGRLFVIKCTFVAFYFFSANLTLLSFRLLILNTYLSFSWYF